MNPAVEPIVVGNVWLHAATMAKVRLPEGARPTDAYMLAVSEQGNLALVGPFSAEGNTSLPDGMQGICAVTTDTPVERIAQRLLTASARGLV